MAPIQRVQLLGPPLMVWADGATKKLTLQEAALLAYLAWEGPQPAARMSQLLWPESGATTAANNLRQCRLRLTSKGGRDLVARGEDLRLADGIVIDVLNIGALDDARLLAALPLLDGMNVDKLDELRHWRAQAQARLQARFAEMLTDRAEAHEQGGRLRAALAAARRVADWQPDAEPAARRVMRLHHQLGERAAGIEVHRRLAQQMRDVHGTRPDAETQAMLETLLSSGSAGPSSPQRTPSSMPGSLLRPPVLVGRHAAWSAMAAAWRERRPLLLIGEAGVGKSRLLESFIDGHPGVVAVRGEPDEGDDGHALLGRLLVQVDARHRPARDGVLRRELARVHPHFGTAPAAPTTPAQLRHALVRWLVGALAAGLKAVVLDDLHLAGRASLEDLLWLSAQSQLAALRIGLASRPWEAGDTAAVLQPWLDGVQQPVRIDLKPLSRDETATLLASLALPALLSMPVLDRLYRTTGGHPLYLLAKLQHEHDRGKSPDVEDTEAAPASVQALLDARIARVPEAVRPLLWVAAVGGADLLVERAARLLDSSPLALAAAWGELEARDVLRAEFFSHAMVRDAALRALPQGLRQSLHRKWAALLQDEGGVAPARIAAHWEQGCCWAEAGRAWHAAGVAARLSGRLLEQDSLFLRAAECHAEAGDQGARVDALLARLDGLHLQQGAATVLEALAEIEILADTSARQLRCSLARIEALLELGHAVEAEAAAAAVLQEPPDAVDLAVPLAGLHAIALAQSDRADAALAAAQRSMALADRSGASALRLKSANALMYVHWAAGRLAEAIAAQRVELACAEALGDMATAAASEGSLAALLASAGDVPGAFGHALRARDRQHRVGLAENSVPAILNSTVLGASASALGRHHESLAALQQAVELAGPEAPAAVRAKACISLAWTWLHLGRADEVRRWAGEVTGPVPPCMQLQVLWLQLRAAGLDGAPTDVHRRAFLALDAKHPGLPPVLDAEFEASFVLPPTAALARLLPARARAAAAGMRGVANGLAWRELVARLALDTPDQAPAVRMLAEQLQPLADDGLMGRCHASDTWSSLAQAWQFLGEPARAVQCQQAGRRWVEQALARLAPDHRATYRQKNEACRALLADRPAA